MKNPFKINLKVFTNHRNGQTSVNIPKRMFIKVPANIQIKVPKNCIKKEYREKGKW